MTTLAFTGTDTRDLIDTLLAHRANQIASDVRRVGASKAIAVETAEWACASAARLRFADRQFSERTIQALAAAGIDFPEQLLFAAEAKLKSIKGIGKGSLNEIMRYRSRFDTPW